MDWSTGPVKVTLQGRRAGKLEQQMKLGKHLQFKLMLTDGKYSTYVVPLKPWPQSFYISAEVVVDRLLEVRPLTITGLVKGVLKNFVTMNWWRINYLLWKCGFYDLNEGETFSWGKLRWKFWETLALRMARQVADRMSVDWRGLL